jgi:hypothetical protein
MSKEKLMRLSAFIAGALLALGVTACSHQRDFSVRTYNRTAPGDDNPNYEGTASGGPSDMGSAGGETYASAPSNSRTMTGDVPEAAQYDDYYEAAKSPRDAGTGGAKDAGSY